MLSKLDELAILTTSFFLKNISAIIEDCHTDRVEVSVGSTRHFKDLQKSLDVLVLLDESLP